MNFEHELQKYRLEIKCVHGILGGFPILIPLRHDLYNGAWSTSGQNEEVPTEATPRIIYTLVLEYEAKAVVIREVLQRGVGPH